MMRPTPTIITTTSTTRTVTATRTASSTGRSSAHEPASGRSPISFGVLGMAALAQAAIFAASGSVALLADLIHNAGDALTAVPLGIAFALRSYRGEKLAGLAVVFAIFVSACVGAYESIQRLLHPEHLTHLWVLAAAGVIGFAGNEIAAQVRLRAGRRLQSPALVADGNHARADGFVSLSVIASALLVAVGLPRADPLIGLGITLVILKITWDSWRVISSTEPGDRTSRTDAHAAHVPTNMGATGLEPVTFRA